MYLTIITIILVDERIREMIIYVHCCCSCIQDAEDGTEGDNEYIHVLTNDDECAYCEGEF